MTTFCIILVLLYMTSEISGLGTCYTNGIDYTGSNINNGLEDSAASAAGCQVNCQMTHGCTYFTWISSGHADPSYRNTCWLKSGKGTPVSCSSCVSGPRVCGGGQCCERMKLDSTGMGDFYQGDKMGGYTRYSVAADGRPIYRQDVTGDNYLFFQEDASAWMVGPSIGQVGGIRNKEDGSCPYNLHQDWEYYRDWTSSWEEDWTMEATCDSHPTNKPDPTIPPDHESCTWGATCNGCQVWSEVNGVRYCCAQNCNSGSIDVSTEDGQVICWCSH